MYREKRILSILLVSLALIALVTTVYLGYITLSSKGVASSPDTNTVEHPASNGSRQTVPKFEKRKEPQAQHPPLPWQTIDPELVDQLPFIRKDIKHARLLSLNRPTIASLSIEDQIELTIPQLDKGFIVKIDKISTGNGAVRSIYGHLEGNRVFGFVLTSSDKAVFATIGTAQGVYNLFGNADYAWIVRANEIDGQLDPSKPDYNLKTTTQKRESS